MANSNSMTNMSSRPHVWWFRDVSGKAHLCCNTWLHAALALRAQCEQDKGPNLFCPVGLPRYVHVSILGAETLRIRSVCLSLWPPGPGPILCCRVPRLYTWTDSWSCSGYILSLISSLRTSFYHTKIHRLKPTCILSHPSDRIPMAKADTLFCYSHTLIEDLGFHPGQRRVQICLPKPGGFAVVSIQQMLHLLKMQSTGLPGSSLEASVCSVIIWIPLE